MLSPERTKRRATRPNPSPSKAGAQHGPPTRSSYVLFMLTALPHFNRPACAFPCPDCLCVLVSLRRGSSSKALKERREKVVPERANQAGGTARIKQRHVRRVGEQQGVPCGCSRLRKESEWEETGTGPVWAFVFCLRDEKPLRSREQRRDVICLVLTGLPVLSF